MRRNQPYRLHVPPINELQPEVGSFDWRAAEQAVAPDAPLRVAQVNRMALSGGSKVSVVQEQN
jgi:hypothetical protein